MVQQQNKDQDCKLRDYKTRKNEPVLSVYGINQLTCHHDFMFLLHFFVVESQLLCFKFHQGPLYALIEPC